MSSPVTPAQIKETIPSRNGNFCQKFLNVLKLPALFYEWYAYWFNEDGTLSNSAAAEICALNCSGIGGGGGGGGGSDSTVPILTASDGTFTNKVVVSWTKIATATYYILYRNDAGINDPTHSATVEIGQLPGTVWEDTNVVLNTIYFYWVKAVIGGVPGSYSNGDQGTVGAEDPAIVPVSGLKASQGYSPPGLAGNGEVVIEFDAVDGADAYEVYRSDTGAFAGEEILINPESLAGTTWRRWQTPTGGPMPSRSRSAPFTFLGDPSQRIWIYGDNFFIRKNGKLVFVDDALVQALGPTPYNWTAEPKEGSLYSYRIVPKKLGTTKLGLLADATTVTGYVGARPGAGAPGSTVAVRQADFVAGVYTIDVAGMTYLRVVLRGHGGSGSGGNTVRAGAGGGAGALVAGEFVVSGETWTIHYSGATPPTSSAHEASGANGYDIVLKKNGVEVLKAGGGGGGVYHAAVACEGGVGGTGDLHGITPDLSNEIIVGEAGFADVNGNGGLGGSQFGTGNVAGQGQGAPGSGSGGCGVENLANILQRRSPAPLFPIAIVSKAP